MILRIGMTVYKIWKSIKNLFHDNKDARDIDLDREIKLISDLLANIDHSVSEKTLVAYLVNGLGENFD